MTEETQTDQPTFSLDNVFNKPRVSDTTSKEDVELIKENNQEKKENTKEKSQEKDKKIKSSQEDKEKEVPKESKPTKDPIDDDDDDIFDDEPTESKKTSDSSKDEIEKLQKTLRDTQKSFHEDRRKLSAYKKAVQKLQEDLVLTDEDAQTLLDHTKFDENTSPSHISESPMQRYMRVWDKEIENMRKYSSDIESLDKHLEAFQNLILTVSHKEREDIIDELSEFENDEVELTKYMLDLGRVYDDEIYSHIREAGSIRNLITKFKNKEEELQNKLDKARNKIVKLQEKRDNDYDDEPYRVRQSSGGSNIDQKPSSSKFDMNAIFNPSRR